VDMIRAPPKGFESAVRKHFFWKRAELRGQAVLWAEEAVLLARLEMEGRRLQAVDPDAVAARVGAELRALVARAGAVRLDRGALGGSPLDPRSFTVPASLPRWSGDVGGGRLRGGGGGGGGGGFGAAFAGGGQPAAGFAHPGGGGDGAQAAPAGASRGRPIPQEGSTYTGPRSCIHLGVLMARLRRLASGDAVDAKPSWADAERSERAAAAATQRLGGGGGVGGGPSDPLLSSLSLLFASRGDGAVADIALATAAALDKGAALPSDFELICRHREDARQFFLAVETLEAAEELLLELANLTEPKDDSTPATGGEI